MTNTLARDAITLLNAIEDGGYKFYGRGRSDIVYFNSCKQHNLYDLAVSIRRRFNNLENITPRVTKMYMNGSSINYIAESLQVSTRTIAKIIKDNGLQERLKQFRYNHTRELLRRCHGNYTAAGKMLGITATAVHERIK